MYIQLSTLGVCLGESRTTAVKYRLQAGTLIPILELLPGSPSEFHLIKTNTTTTRSVPPTVNACRRHGSLACITNA